MFNLPLETEDSAVPLTIVSIDAVENWLANQPQRTRNWLNSTGFSGKAGDTALIPSESGAISTAVFITPIKPKIWDFAILQKQLPKAIYSVTSEMSPDQATNLSLAWTLSSYYFNKYKTITNEEQPAELVWPESCRRDEATRIAEAVCLVRDLINTPAIDMGPDNLALAAENLSSKHNAEISVTVGDDLLKANFPAIHAVGKANDREPRLIDISWGQPDAPKVTLVGKGVCFDTGGLNIKPTNGMKFMKKDMGGAAHVLGAAHAIMSAELSIRLRVLVPAVENSISGNAMRPGDVVQTRKGLTIEIGNTDAEGRIILSDVLTEAATEKPEMIIDFATLTGAARVALGTELPALFCNDDDLASGLLTAGHDANDPLWHMPLWEGYEKQVDGKVADVNNAPEGGYGGSITAALFLQRFITDDVPWAHIDMMAWNLSNKPGRPEGGEAMGLRAIIKYLEHRYST